MFTIKQVYQSPDLEIIELRLGTTVLQGSLIPGKAGGDDDILDEGDMN